MQTKVLVESGICGMQTQIMLRGSLEAGYQIVLTTSCPLVQSLEPKLQDMDLLMGAVGRISQNPVFQAAEAHRLHAACPVPIGLIKAFEVFCGLALPADVGIEIEKQGK
ncbi:MAG: hypothetical protein GX998_04350 [Firmicutes bacterium]|nr:hypothetical protein [Bacillota bacterium]